jgi:hypothetical protein
MCAASNAVSLVALSDLVVFALIAASVDADAPPTRAVLSGQLRALALARIVCTDLLVEFGSGFCSSSEAGCLAPLGWGLHRLSPGQLSDPRRLRLAPSFRVMASFLARFWVGGARLKSAGDIALVPAAGYDPVGLIRTSG